MEKKYNERLNKMDKTLIKNGITVKAELEIFFY